MDINTIDTRNTNKTKWTKTEILEMGVDYIPSVNEAMNKGYFSKSLLGKNKIEFNVDSFSYAYSGAANAYVKVYKSDVGFKLFIGKKLMF